MAFSVKRSIWNSPMALKRINHNNLLSANYSKALYGLKQAPRAWFERLSHFLHSLGFVTSRADSSLIIRQTPDHCCYILVYVDDIVITGSSSTVVNQLINTMNKKFALKDLGPLSFFVGIEVSYPPTGGLFLSQSKYIQDLLNKTNGGFV